MKKVLGIFVLAATLVACNDNADSTTTEDSTTITTNTTVDTANTLNLPPDTTSTLQGGSDTATLRIDTTGR